ncbi:MAG: hypothetical protein HY594_04550 [Candidatus Omnitrophica bacterium]|nr:hypothetical protein [Candidatus Omnitrophota bacterium]
MTKKISLVVFIAAALFGTPVRAEKVEFTTYYPSPSSDFSQLNADYAHSNRATVGAKLKAFSLATAPADATLAVGGRVGVGTATPVAALHLVGQALVAASSTNGDTLRFRTDPNYWAIGQDAAIVEKTEGASFVDGGVILGVSSSTADNTLAGGAGWAANFLPLLTVRGPGAINVSTGLPPFPGGRVGIGTDAPKALLHVQGASDAAAEILFMEGVDTPAAGTPSLRVGIGAAPDPKSRLYVQAQQPMAQYGIFANQASVVPATPNGRNSAIEGRWGPVGETINVTAGALGVSYSDSKGIVNRVGVFGSITPQNAGYAGYFEGDVMVTGKVFGGQQSVWLADPVLVWDPAGSLENAWRVVVGVPLTQHPNEVAVLKIVINEARVYIRRTGSSASVGNQSIVVRAGNNSSDVGFYAVPLSSTGTFEAQFQRTDPSSFNVEIYCLGFLKNAVVE